MSSTYEKFWTLTACGLILKNILKLTGNRFINYKKPTSAKMKHNGNGDHIGIFWVLSLSVGFFFRSPDKKAVSSTVFYDIGAFNAAFW